MTISKVRLGVCALLLTGTVAGAVVWRHVAAAGASPLAQSALPAAERYRFDGVVRERLPAGSYTYLLVEPARGPADWVVTLGKGPAVRESVSVRVVGRARDFKSARLSRTFSLLLFAVVSRADAQSGERAR